MRKFVVVLFLLFTVSVFALVTTAQRRSARSHGHGAVANPAAAPQSRQIAQELAGVQWGWTHDQVVDYFRRALFAQYTPRLKNQGQVEQDRLMQERDRQVQQLRESYVLFDGAQRHRLWDTSFVAGEYTHNNGESVLVSEDPSNGNREFYFFFNDHLWKRFQARTVPSGSGLDFPAFVSRIEQLFGHGLHINDADHPDRLATVVWQDAATRLHVVDNSTFYNAFCLVYEDKGTLSRLAELRRNAPPTKASNAAAQVDIEQPNVGNADTDSNADIVDRITGKIRHTQTASNGSSTGTSSQGGTSSTGSTGGSTNNTQGGSGNDSNGSGSGSSNSGSGGSESDPLRGL